MLQDLAHQGQSRASSEFEESANETTESNGPSNLHRVSDILDLVMGVSYLLPKLVVLLDIRIPLPSQVGHHRSSFAQIAFGIVERALECVDEVDVGLQIGLAVRQLFRQTSNLQIRVGQVRVKDGREPAPSSLP